MSCIEGAAPGRMVGWVRSCRSGEELRPGATTTGIFESKGAAIVKFFNKFCQVLDINVPRRHHFVKFFN